MKVTFEVQDEEVRSAFTRMVANASESRGYLSAIGEALKNTTKMRFASGTDPGGAAWAPVIRGGAPLRNTGAHLMNAVNYRVGSDHVEIGVPPAWGAVHQFGATIQARNAKYLRFKVGNRWVRKKQVTVPARPFLGISTEDRAEILDILRKYLLP